MMIINRTQPEAYAVIVHGHPKYSDRVPDSVIPENVL